ncbi:hypothetical protein PENSPDRAFT_443851 [Peniophora sp. CONT]|nr:hypothetical protein PENSPDRAFT_443851 [Peniophora sp. CONT]
MDSSIRHLLPRSTLRLAMATFSCTICFNEWPDTEALRSLLCGHTFCETCIQEHLNRGRTFCPSCRAEPVLREHVRPVFVTAEVQKNTTQNLASRKQVLTVPLDKFPRLRELESDLLSITSNLSRVDLLAVTNNVLEFFASDDCNGTVRNILTGALATFLDNNAAPAYEAVHGKKVAGNTKAGSPEMSTVRQAASAHPRETTSLEDMLSELRVGNRNLAQRSENLSDELMATQRYLVRSQGELTRTQEGLESAQAQLTLIRDKRERENGESSWRAMKLGGELLETRKELDRTNQELKRAREEATNYRTKYENLDAEVGGAIRTLSAARSSGPAGQSAHRGCTRRSKEQ